MVTVLKRRDVVNADTQRWSPPAGMSPYLSASNDADCTGRTYGRRDLVAEQRS
jgi:hypothetical protein